MNAPPPADAQKATAYVVDLNENDVLLGRGAPILNSPGNVQFRKLIAADKAAYTATGRHFVKDEIARRILVNIAERGGRFLRKIESAAEKLKLQIPDGVHAAWLVVDEAASLQKVKQALRENLSKPSARKKGQSSDSTIAGGPSSVPPTTRKRKSLAPEEEKTGFRGISVADHQAPRPLYAMMRNDRPAGLAAEAEHSAGQRLTASHRSEGDLEHSPSRRAAQRPRTNSATLEGLDLLVRMKNPSVSESDLRREHRHQAFDVLQGAETTQRGLEPANAESPQGGAPLAHEFRHDFMTAANHGMFAAGIPPTQQQQQQYRQLQNMGYPHSLVAPPFPPNMNLPPFGSMIRAGEPMNPIMEQFLMSQQLPTPGQAMNFQQPLPPQLPQPPQEVATQPGREEQRGEAVQKSASGSSDEGKKPKAKEGSV